MGPPAVQAADRAALERDGFFITQALLPQAQCEALVVRLGAMLRGEYDTGGRPDKCLVDFNVSERRLDNLTAVSRFHFSGISSDVMTFLRSCFIGLRCFRLCFVSCMFS